MPLHSHISFGGKLLDEKPTRSVKISSPSLTVQPKFSSSTKFAQPNLKII